MSEKAEMKSLFQALQEKAHEAEGSAIQCRREGDYDLAQWYEGVARGIRDSMLVAQTTSLTPDELRLAAVACDLYADEFPESIDEADPDGASERLHALSAKLVAEVDRV